MVQSVDSRGGTLQKFNCFNLPKTGPDCWHWLQMSACVTAGLLFTVRIVEYFYSLQIFSAINEVKDESLARDAHGPVNTNEVKLMKIEKLRS